MGKGIEQESFVTPNLSQCQVLGLDAQKFTVPITVVRNMSFSGGEKGCLIIPGSYMCTSKSTTKPNSNKFCNSQAFSSPPLTFSHDTGIFSDNNEFFFRSLKNSSYIDVRKITSVPLRKCPGGKTNNSSGAGSGNNSGSNSGGHNWVLSSGGGSSGGPFSERMGGGAGGGDDDPFKNRQINSAPFSLPFIDDDEFNSFTYLDEALIEDLLRDIPMNDIVLNQHPQFGFTRDNNSYSYPTESSDPPSTPAPLTPMTPISVPSTTTPNRIHQGQPHRLSIGQASVNMGISQATTETSDMKDLLDINKLMINGGGSGISDFANAKTLIPQPHTLVNYPIQPSSQLSGPSQILLPAGRVQPAQSHTPGRSTVIDFLAATSSVLNDHHVIEVFVPFDLAPEKTDIGWRALQHCYDVCFQYTQALQNGSVSELQVAVQQVGQMCVVNMNMAANPSPRMSFTMPSTCIPLSQWDIGNHSLAQRQLVLQQFINTLTILFKAQNNLCFWGSSQIWVDTNLRVYLYIDFIKALAIQKEYADRGLQCNPRVEDCKVLSELFGLVLKPYLSRDFTWVSNQLRCIFDTFEVHLSSPERCVSNMADVARVLGARRICKLQVDLMVGAPFNYTLYCCEHETISDCLDTLSGVLPASVSRLWSVVHARDNSPVSVTEIATKESDGKFIIMPYTNIFNQRLPGALYLESKQQPW